MISNSAKKVSIYITTYKTEEFDSNNAIENNMDKTFNQNDNEKRFFCAMCLNNNRHNVDCGRKIPKSCHICTKNHTCNHRNVNKNDDALKFNDTAKITNDIYENTNVRRVKDNTKDVQTSQTDLTQDLSLLKEVLTVFKTKKQLDMKTNSKTVVMKDVSVETESKSKINLTAKLTKSRIFQFSIEEGKKNNGNNFKIVNYSQPNNAKSQYAIDLIKHKSSSIPQMKIEELKYSLKEKTKSKDAIEEVNRMFATVRKSDFSNLEEENRPMIRNGPRVLPVVKTPYETNRKSSDYDHSDAKKSVYKSSIKENSDYDGDAIRKPKTKDIHGSNKRDEIETDICKCCQTNNIQLSGGDSFFKHECCYHKMLCEGKCEKCVYMLCCHYQKHNKIETGSLICECCVKNTNDKDDGCAGSDHRDRC